MFNILDYLGFKDKAENTELLHSHDGDMDEVVQTLLTRMHYPKDVTIASPTTTTTTTATTTTSTTSTNDSLPTTVNSSSTRFRADYFLDITEK